MLWVIQLVTCFASVSFVSQYFTLKIIDFGHNFLPTIPSEIPHVLAGVLVASACFFAPKKEKISILQNVYAPAMFIKASLIPWTILPDANPACSQLSTLGCLTRNDMLPSGHMIAAMCAAAAINHNLAYLAAVTTGIMLVASRMHYTVDVVLAIWICHLLHASHASKEAQTFNMRNAVRRMQAQGEFGSKHVDSKVHILPQDCL